MMPQFIFRPVEAADHSRITKLIRKNTGGMTTLSDKPDVLLDRINDSCRAFDPRIHKPGSEVYLFVLEEISTGNIVGTSGILSRVGGFDPFYTYEIKRTLLQYEPLNIHNTLKMLELVKDHKGPTEICSLLLDPEYRQLGLGKLLSLSRFCFIKAFPERFDETIIAELRGYIDPDEKSPFWEAVGKNFFWSDYYSADVLSGVGEKDFIEALMPEYPIYIDLLPQSARDVIGKVHPHTVPAKRILMKEGFTETAEVDIFDAGPILKVKRGDLNTWKAAKSVRVHIETDPTEDLQMAILANTSLDYRATTAGVRVLDQDEVIISKETAAALNIIENDKIQLLLI